MANHCVAGVYDAVWFIIVFYVLLPVFLIVILFVLVVYCLRKNKRK